MNKGTFGIILVIISLLGIIGVPIASYYYQHSVYYQLEFESIELGSTLGEVCAVMKCDKPILLSETRVGKTWLIRGYKYIFNPDGELVGKYKEK